MSRDGHSSKGNVKVMFQSPPKRRAGDVMCIVVNPLEYPGRWIGYQLSGPRILDDFF